MLEHIAVNAGCRQEIPSLNIQCEIRLRELHGGSALQDFRNKTNKIQVAWCPVQRSKDTLPALRGDPVAWCDAAFKRPEINPALDHACEALAARIERNRLAVSPSLSRSKVSAGSTVKLPASCAMPPSSRATVQT